MTRPVLVTYATRYGSTGDVAGAIGNVLTAAGLSADVRPVEAVTGLDTYDGVVVGSPVRGDRWMPEALDFVRTHRKTLATLPVAYFVVCLTMRKDTPAVRRIAEGFLDEIRIEVPEVQPVEVGLFAGRVDPGRLPWILRLSRPLLKVPKGDYRDWDAIRDWARDLAARLDEHVDRR